MAVKVTSAELSSAFRPFFPCRFCMFLVWVFVGEAGGVGGCRRRRLTSARRREGGDRRGSLCVGEAVASPGLTPGRRWPLALVGQPPPPAANQLSDSSRGGIGHRTARLGSARLGFALPKTPFFILSCVRPCLFVSLQPSDLKRFEPAHGLCPPPPPPSEWVHRY